MSGFRAIAGVSASLRTLLRDRMEDPVPITLAPPETKVSGMTGRRLNLYLYQLQEHAQLKNQEIPGHGHPGTYGHPPLSLNLFYLMTAFGSSDEAADADLEAQQALGDAMRVLHDFAILSDQVAITRPSVGVPGQPILDVSLLGAYERLHISLHPLELQEVTRVWTENSFRRSVAYQVTVVQIESRLPGALALPVRERKVLAVPFRSPQINEVFQQPPPFGVRASVAAAGETLRLHGVNLGGENTRVQLDTVSISITPPGSDTDIDVTVPATVLAGARVVRVIHDLMLGEPPVAHPGFESNAAVFLLIPTIAGVAPPTAGAGGTLTLTLNPPVGAEQTVTLLLGDHALPANARPFDSPPSATVAFSLPTGVGAIPAGTYLMRVRVDGAESRLTLDPVTRRYSGPTYPVT